MRIAITAACTTFLLLVSVTASAEEASRTIPAPALDNPRTANGTETAVLAGGCYWGTQGIFEHVKGVRSVVAGFSGAQSVSPDQDSLMARATLPAAESIKIEYDPSQISYGQLLQIYFAVAHDPTQLNHQGPDNGPQYRSDIFYMDDTQKKIAEAYVGQLQAANIYASPIVTRLDGYSVFRKVANSQQDFMLHHPDLPYIVINDAPRVTDFKKLYPDLYQDTPVTVTGIGAGE